MVIDKLMPDRYSFVHAEKKGHVVSHRMGRANDGGPNAPRINGLTSSVFFSRKKKNLTKYAPIEQTAPAEKLLFPSPYILCVLFQTAS